eukprot:4384906-Prymnesium_polylepis.1
MRSRLDDYALAPQPNESTPVAAQVLPILANAAADGRMSPPLLLAVLGVVPRTPSSLHEPDHLKYPVLPLGEGRVFFAGLQKAGTTSFAAMMDHLGLRTVHGTGYGFFRNNQSCLDDVDGTVGPSAANGWRPDYERVLYELGPDRVRDMLVLGKVQAASDTAWPLLFPFIAKLFPKAKFVLWPRPAAKW